MLFSLGNDDFKLETANRLYVQEGYPLLEGFLDKTAKHFGAEAVNVDFANSGEAAKAINEWVEKVRS